MPVLEYPFRPQATLHTQDVVGIGLGDSLHQRVEGIRRLQGEKPPCRLVLGRILVMVQIIGMRRGKDDVVAFGNGLDAARSPVPGHDGGIRSQTAFQNLVPADDALSVLGCKTLHPPDHIALQLFLGLQALGLHPGLAVRARFPVPLTGLVPAYVDIIAGEQLKNFRKHRFQELVGAFLARTYLPLVRPFFFRQGTGQVRIGRTGLVIVPGHLNLGNHFYVPFGRKGQNLGNILFGIVAAISSRGAFLYKVASRFILFPVPEIGLGAPGGKLRKPGVCVYLQAPAGIVHQMEMETVHLQERHHLQLLLHKLLPLEMPALVQQDAAIAETRPVQNGAERDAAVLQRQHTKGLPGIKHALLIGRFNLHALFPHLQPVGRFKLPIGQFPALQAAPDSTFRDSDLLEQLRQDIGREASGTHGILCRRRDDVLRLQTACHLILPGCTAC